MIIAALEVATAGAFLGDDSAVRFTRLHSFSRFDISSSLAKRACRRVL
jgi:hypothetical protein